jgi:hypothetical protein
MEPGSGGPLSEPADNFNPVAWQAYFFLRFAKGRIFCTPVMRLGLAAGKGNLACMASEMRCPLRQQNGHPLRAFNNRHEYGGRRDAFGRYVIAL